MGNYNYQVQLPGNSVQNKGPTLRNSTNTNFIISIQENEPKKSLTESSEYK